MVTIKELRKNDVTIDVPLALKELAEVGIKMTEEALKKRLIGDPFDIWVGCSGAENYPAQSEGRLTYNIVFNQIHACLGQVGWAEKETYHGRAIRVHLTRAYLLGIKHQPSGKIVLDLTNSPKGDLPQIDHEEARALFSKASMLVDLLLENPASRSCDSYIAGRHAADLSLKIDPYTHALKVYIPFEFKMASSRINGRLAFHSAGDLAAHAWQRTEESTAVLYKEGSARNSTSGFGDIGRGILGGYETGIFSK